MVALSEFAPAKVNLTLRVIDRRADGYHDLESFVVFACAGDTLVLVPGDDLSLVVNGPCAAAAGDISDNLVLRAARALAARYDGLRTGQFILDKQLPVAAGLGGGSADAAAALRLLARANDIPLDDARLFAAARATGADVPVCLRARVSLMSGIGDILSDPIDLHPLPCVLVNPGVAVATRDVFAKLNLDATEQRQPRFGRMFGGQRSSSAFGDLTGADFIKLIVHFPNDLEPAAISLQPVIGKVLEALRARTGCRLARMSGSGATCFGLFDDDAAAQSAAAELSGAHPNWWVRADRLS